MSFTTELGDFRSPHLRLSSDDDRWEAVRMRDGAADGAFVYSTWTTGVYRRLSYAARRVQRESVRFLRACADAERAGFRPCKRCRPEEAPRGERQA